MYEILEMFITFVIIIVFFHGKISYITGTFALINSTWRKIATSSKIAIEIYYKGIQPVIKWLLSCRQDTRNGASAWQDRDAHNSNSSQRANSRNACVARVTEIPARVVLHERPFDIPTCCRQTPTNVILLQCRLRSVTWKARCNYIIHTLNPRRFSKWWKTSQKEN